MFETINNWIVVYMETPHYQRTIECECLFFLAIAIYMDTVGYANKVADQREKIEELEKKVEVLEKDASSIPALPNLAEKINDITCRYHMPVTPIDRRKARPEHIFQCVQELAEYAKKQRNHIYSQDAIIANQKEQINEIEKKAKVLQKKVWDPDWCRLIDKLNEIIDKEAAVPFIPPECKKVYTNAEDEIWDKLNYLATSLCLRNNLIKGKDKRIRELENKVNDLDVANRRLKLENEKLILVPGGNAIENAIEIIELKAENHMLREEVESLKGQNEVLKIKNTYPIRPIFGVDDTISKLREENDKLKDALKFCQKEAVSAREHAHNVEVNAERIRLGID